MDERKGILLKRSNGEGYSKVNEYITFALGSVPFTFHLTFVLLLSSPIPFFNRILMVASGVE